MSPRFLLDRLPAAIKPPVSLSVYLEIAARGVQIYACEKNGALDGGIAVGEPKESAPAPHPDDIPWLLLDIKSAEGEGVFTQAKAILRVATHGGLAPGAAYSGAEDGKTVRVPYEAIYLFLK